MSETVCLISTSSNLKPNTKSGIHRYLQKATQMFSTKATSVAARLRSVEEQAAIKVKQVHQSICEMCRMKSKSS
jgi:hypothetical protein